MKNLKNYRFWYIVLIILSMGTACSNENNAKETATPPPPPPTSTVTIDSADLTPGASIRCALIPTLAKDKTISFEIVADVSQSMETIQLVFDYDESALSFVNMTMGSGFDIQGINQEYPDPTKGKMLAFAAARSVQGPVASGQITVVTANFTVLKSDKTQLSFINNNAADETGTLAYLVGERIPVVTADCVATP